MICCSMETSTSSVVQTPGPLSRWGGIAVQALRGKGLPHQQFGCGILLASVLFCALVHFAVGGASVGRARTILRRARESRGHRLFRQTNQVVAWIATAIQIALLVLGIILILKESPPYFFQKYLLPLF